ncbi:MAG: hypothetical protein D6682_03130 [Zetaproteobacteria bacterium]|nr:MAG: hypothetical protein D6682_03130 [Zetaproteobacteria bacterium]
MTESEIRHLNMILEEMNSKMSLVLEGYAALDEKVERYHREAKEDHRLVMDLLKFSHKELDGKIDAVHEELDGKIDAVHEKLDKKIDAVHEELKETREELAARMDAIGGKVEAHEERITILERKVA